MANTADHPPKLLDQVRAKIRLKHYSIRAEQAYVDWIRRYILFHGERHPNVMGGAEAESFLTHLAVNGKVSASTQNQAKAALLFLYREVLVQELPWLDNVEQAKAPKRLPRLTGVYWLMGSLLYGAGLMLMECVRLRVKDADFGHRQIVVREAKGLKDRVR